jgi:Inner membrane protein YgaP-like, transmembrane domain
MKKMNVDRLVLTFAGIFIIGSLVLSRISSPYWLLFTAFVGANLFQASFTGFCPLAKILKAMGVKRGEVFRV